MDENLIEITEVKNNLGGKWVHQGVNLTVKRGEILAIVGGSGSGKTTLLRNILMLLPPTAGKIKIFGQDLATLNEEAQQALRQRWGVTFQQNALFGTLTVLDNVLYPLREYRKLARDFCEELALLKVRLTGLKKEASYQYPAELSGGMQKRAALARAIALDPEILFLDEPTAGLDPQSAGEVDDLIVQLQRSLALTVVIITHDLDTLWQITDRVAFLGDGKVLAALPMHELIHASHPLIQAYFAGPRGQRQREYEQ